MEQNEQNRISRIEEFLLDPEKTIFNSIEEFTEAAKILVDFLNNVNFEQLDTIQGEDGYTPVRGVDYFTPEDITAFETFLLERIPVEGIDYPTVQEVQAFISSEVAKIPRVKGDKGAKGDKGQDGKNGSPDTGIDIVRKLRAMTSKDGLKISDVKGLTPKIKLLNETVEDVEELRERVESLGVVLPKLEEKAGGDVNTVTGKDSVSVTGTAVDRVVSLVNDAGNPGNSKYYGTDISGNKGYHNLPAGSGAVDSVNGQTGTVILDSDDISEGSTNKYNVQSDWNASSGDAQILNKPALGTMASETASDYTKTANLGDLALKDQVTVPTDINASGTPSSSTYLRGDGTWATPAGGGGGTMDNFNINADSGTQQTIDDSDTILFEGGTGIDTVVSATDKITIGLDSASQTSLGLADTAIQNLADLGITATASELNTLDGITASTTELNYVDGVTSPIQTQLDGKASKNKRVSTTASTASITPDITSYDVYELTAQAVNFTLNLPSEDVSGQAITVRILANDDKTLTINGSYKSIGSLPSALVNGKRYEFIINQFNTGGSKEYWVSGVEI